jgi:hypothetical protein
MLWYFLGVMKTINCTLNFEPFLKLLSIIAPNIFFTVSDGQPELVQPWFGNPDHLEFDKDGVWGHTHEFAMDPEKTLQITEAIPLTDFPSQDPEFMKIFESARMPNVTLWLCVGRE